MGREYINQETGEVETEEQRILKWRTEELKRAGLQAADAARLASGADVDLNETIETFKKVLASGGSYEHAVRIVAPLGEPVIDDDREKVAA